MSVAPWADPVTFLTSGTVAPFGTVGPAAKVPLLFRSESSLGLPPSRSPVPQNRSADSQRQLAVFIDFENLALGVRGKDDRIEIRRVLDLA